MTKKPKNQNGSAATNADKADQIDNSKMTFLFLLTKASNEILHHEFLPLVSNTDYFEKQISRALNSPHPVSVVVHSGGEVSIMREEIIDEGEIVLFRPDGVCNDIDVIIGKMQQKCKRKTFQSKLLDLFFCNHESHRICMEEWIEMLNDVYNDKVRQDRKKSPLQDLNYWSFKNEKIAAKWGWIFKIENPATALTVAEQIVAEMRK